jgi:hypothetical protein
MMTTQKQVRDSFWDMLGEVAPSLAKQRRSRLRQNDYCTDIRVSFVDYVDSLQKQGEISESLAQIVTL